MTLEETLRMLKNVLLIHEHDPNFPLSILHRIQAFLGQSCDRGTRTTTRPGDTRARAVICEIPG